MSKSTLAIIAAASAGAGAAVTASMFSTRSQSDRPYDTISQSSAATPFTGAINPSSSSVPVPARDIFTAPSQPQISSSGHSGSAPVDPAGIFEYGFPGPVADLATRQALISAFDRRLRNPHWVVEHITPASLAIKGADRKNSAFLEDESIPEKFRAKLKDYLRSGYDRGHQVPAADAKWSQSAMDETFYLSNMTPQVGEGFNRDYWSHFEDFCRRLTHKYPSVRIVTGPLYLPQRDPNDNKWYVKYEVIGSPPNVAVPTHFYKVIFAEEDGSSSPSGNVAIAAFVLPNARIPNDKPLADFEVPLETVERASGLEFATKLPVQRQKRLCRETSCSLIIKEYAKKAFKS